MTLLAVITQHAVTERILTKVQIPREPLSTNDGFYYDVTGQSVPSWAMGVDPDPDRSNSDPGPDQRGPPQREDLSFQARRIRESPRPSPRMGRVRQREILRYG
jgi:hypothetical protein